jgi:hypothetical protein
VEQKIPIIAVLASAIVIAAVIIVLVSNKPPDMDSYTYRPSSSNTLNAGNLTGGQIPDAQGATNQATGQGSNNQTAAQVATSVKRYGERYPFYTFQDPNEGAFTIKIPVGWQVMNGSGLVRPYIDAAVSLAAGSQDRGFGLIAPYAIYTIPTPLLDRLGFSEGTYYGGYGDIVKPMLVKSYMTARQFIDEFMGGLNVETEIVGIKDRPDLLSSSPDPSVTKQSAAELAYISLPGPNQVMNKLIVATSLVGSESQGVWVAYVFGYYSPESVFNETEYLVLKSAESLKIDQDWAKREAVEMNKRLKITSATAESISKMISSSFYYKSESMDNINGQWSNAILGVEEVYNPDTGDRYIVDSGSNYYWVDNAGNIYGTETDESPYPQEDLKHMDCPGCNE